MVYDINYRRLALNSLWCGVESRESVDRWKYSGVNACGSFFFSGFVFPCGYGDEFDSPAINPVMSGVNLDESTLDDPVSLKVVQFGSVDECEWDSFERVVLSS